MLQFFSYLGGWVIGRPLTLISLLFHDLNVKGRVFECQVRLFSEQSEEGGANSDAIAGRFHHQTELFLLDHLPGYPTVTCIGQILLELGMLQYFVKETILLFSKLPFQSEESTTCFVI